MTTLADQLAQALALVSTGALDEDYSKIATAAAVAPPLPLPAGRPLAALAPDGAMCENYARRKAVYRNLL